MDLFGPDGVTRAVATRPAEPSNPAAADSFFGDCVGGAPGTGTPIPAHWLNRITMQMRRLVRLGGLADAYDDNLTTRAVRRAERFRLYGGGGVGTVGGTANAITAATTSPMPALTSGDLPGMTIWIVPTADNTGNVTFNPDGLGAAAVTWPDGTTQLAPGTLVSGRASSIRHDGTAWRLQSALPPSGIQAAIETQQVPHLIGTFSTLFAFNTVTRIPFTSVRQRFIDPSTTYSGGLFTFGPRDAGLWMATAWLNANSRNDTTIIWGYLRRNGTAFAVTGDYSAGGSPGGMNTVATGTALISAGDTLDIAGFQQNSGGFSQTITGGCLFTRLGA
jgi:hypothetical protein